MRLGLIKTGVLAALSMAFLSGVAAKAQDEGDMHRHMEHRMMRHEMMRHEMMRHEMRHEMRRHMMHRMMHENGY